MTCLQCTTLYATCGSTIWGKQLMLASLFPPCYNQTRKLYNVGHLGQVHCEPQCWPEAEHLFFHRVRIESLKAQSWVKMVNWWAR